MAKLYARRLVLTLATGLLLVQVTPALAHAQDGCYAYRPEQGYFECDDTQGCSSRAWPIDCSPPSRWGYTHCACGEQRTCCGTPYWTYIDMPCGYYCIKPQEAASKTAVPPTCRPVTGEQFSPVTQSAGRTTVGEPVSNRDGAPSIVGASPRQRATDAVVLVKRRR